MSKIIFGNSGIPFRVVAQSTLRNDPRMTRECGRKQGLQKIVLPGGCTFAPVSSLATPVSNIGAQVLHRELRRNFGMHEGCQPFSIAKFLKLPSNIRLKRYQ
jgi:hypothetical protein